MSFPDKKYNDIISYSTAYFAEYTAAAATVDMEELDKAAGILTKAYETGRTVYSCGNGGSAAIANHLVCDHCKLVQTDTKLTPRVHSLSSAIELITAIGNDISYDEIFAYQLSSLAQSGDVLLTISSSGDSENIVRAIHWARNNGIKVIAMTGFSGGRSAVDADVNLHVTAENYGIVEDVHQSLMHLLAQYIRQGVMDERLVIERKF